MEHTRAYLNGAIAALEKLASFRLPNLPAEAVSVARQNPEGAIHAAVNGIMQGIAEAAEIYRAERAALPPVRDERSAILSEAEINEPHPDVLRRLQPTPVTRRDEEMAALEGRIAALREVLGKVQVTSVFYQVMILEAVQLDDALAIDAIKAAKNA